MINKYEAHQKLSNPLDEYMEICCEISYCSDSYDRQYPDCDTYPNKCNVLTMAERLKENFIPRKLIETHYVPKAEIDKELQEVMRYLDCQYNRELGYDEVMNHMDRAHTILTRCLVKLQKLRDGEP